VRSVFIKPASLRSLSALNTILRLTEPPNNAIILAIEGKALVEPSNPLKWLLMAQETRIAERDTLDVASEVSSVVEIAAKVVLVVI